MKTVAIVMGSDSDWRILQDAALTLIDNHITAEAALREGRNGRPARCAPFLWLHSILA